MTQVVLEKSKSQIDITIMGHCNAGRINGFDLCCCAVSMLCFTLMDSLAKLSLNGFSSKYRGGWCHIRFDRSDKKETEAQTVINTVFNGFRLLSGRFPSNVAVYCPDFENSDERSDNNEYHK